MTLVWKLLRQHISIPQFVGFFFANLFGMLIVLLGIQFYADVKPVFTSGDSFMKPDYLIVSKKIGVGTTLSGRANAFNGADIDDFSRQDFVKNLGSFTPTEYRVGASMGVNGQRILNTELYFESVPDEFVDVSLKEWTYEAGSREVPIILPRIYINMYNFGFAQSRSLPKISDGLMGMIDFTIDIHGNGSDDLFKGRVIGFSSRLNTILVPQSFMDWSNAHYAPQSESQPTRLIVEVGNPADERIAQYIERKNYEVETDKLDAEKTTYFLKMTVFLVMGIGLIIAALSFYILMLSIYLLVQKNAEKLENLLLIGYSPSQVALLYQLLTILLNVVVLVIAFILLLLVRNYYYDILELLFPRIEGSLTPSVVAGVVIFAVVSLLNIWAVRRKIIQIWKRKE